MLYCYLYALTYVCHNEELNMFTSSSLIKQNNKTQKITRKLCFCFLYINNYKTPIGGYGKVYILFLFSLYKY